MAGENLPGDRRLSVSREDFNKLCEQVSAQDARIKSQEEAMIWTGDLLCQAADSPPDRENPARFNHDAMKKLRRGRELAEEQDAKDSQFWRWADRILSVIFGGAVTEAWAHWWPIVGGHH